MIIVITGSRSVVLYFISTIHDGGTTLLFPLCICELVYTCIDINSTYSVPHELVYLCDHTIAHT